MNLKGVLLGIGLANLLVCNLAFAAIDSTAIKDIFSSAADRGVALVPHTGSITGDHVNIRTAPTTGQSHVITQGNYVDVVIFSRQDGIDEAYPWYRVLLTSTEPDTDNSPSDTDGYLGWVYGQYLKVGEATDFFEAFAQMAKAETGITPAQTTALWGSPEESKKEHIGEFNWDVTSYIYSDGTLLKFRGADGQRRLQTANITKVGKGLGGLYVGEAWCNQGYVYSYLGKPKSIAYNDGAEKNEIWEYSNGTGMQLLQIEFTAAKTIKKLTYNFYAD